VKDGRILVVIASAWDEAARSLVERWSPRAARLLTPSDLSLPGWRHRVGSVSASTAIVSGEPIAASAIGGVYTRLPGVYEHELLQIAPEDRAYVAAEMHAFLVSWLTELPCPVVNRPTPVCLAGPAWRHEQWIHVADRVGIRVAPARRRVSLTAPAEPETPPTAGATVTVVGRRGIGSVAPCLERQARRLAEAAGVELLAAHFSSPRPDAQLVAASSWPDIADSDVSEALREHLSER
jgi:hypothetical protein